MFTNVQTYLSHIENLVFMKSHPVSVSASSGGGGIVSGIGRRNVIVLTLILVMTLYEIFMPVEIG
jgi:hypothetical protein